MHVLLGLLGTIVTILYLFHRLAEMGISLGGLNPFYWRRRRAWRKQYEGDPIFAVEDPMEVAALIVVAIAKLEGDISAEQKQTAILEFKNKFSLSDRDAAQLLASSSHLLAHPQVIRTQLDGLMTRHKELFTAEQTESLVSMMRNIASVEGSPSEEQNSLLAEVQNRFAAPPSRDGVWS